ncbi:hypothetical protein ACL7TT_11715 [Microbulbifer sp. 2304DJ12-6]
MAHAIAAPLNLNFEKDLSGLQRAIVLHAIAMELYGPMVRRKM